MGASRVLTGQRDLFQRSRASANLARVDDAAFDELVVEVGAVERLFYLVEHAVDLG
jgi:hypothetical protein